jgi:type II secretory pathway component GspD/PulD (secretin)
MALAAVVAALGALPGGLGTPSCRAQTEDQLGSVHAILHTAIDAYRRGDYERAGRLLQMAQVSQNELSPDEANDLAKYLGLNGKALRQRQEGAKLVRLADQAVKTNNFAEARRLLKALTANQWLAPADKQLAQELAVRLGDGSAPPPAPPPEGAKPRGEEKSPGAEGPAVIKGEKELAEEARRMLREARTLLAQKNYEAARQNALEAQKTGAVFSSREDTPQKVLADVEKAQRGAAGTAGPKPDSKALLARARAALQRGDLDAAERLAAESEQAAGKAGGLPNWLHPWSDTPAKVRRDIQAARLKNPPAAKPGPKGEGQAAHRADPSAPGGESRPAKSEIQTVKYQATGDETAPPAGDKGPGAKGPGVATSQARQLVEEGRKALKEGHLRLARRKAEEARGLKPDLKWWEDNPEKLLADVDRQAARTGKSSGAGQAAAKGGGGDAAAASADAGELLKQARALFAQGKLDDAEKLSQQASLAAKKRWGIFSDSPEKLRNDIRKARVKRDQAESKKVLAQARQLFTAGNLKEAKTKAFLAQRLHGPYSIWDLGDRPQRLINEIEAAEFKARKSKSAVLPPSAVARRKEPLPENTEAARSDEDKDDNVRQTSGKAGPEDVADPVPDNPPAPQSSRAPEDDERQRAVQLLAEARRLQAQGHLSAARRKALEAQKTSVAFGPDEDRPEIALLQLRNLCDTRIASLLKHASDCMACAPSDPAQLTAAQADLKKAKQLTVEFGFDASRVERHQAALLKARKELAGRGVLPEDGPPSDLVKAKAVGDDGPKAGPPPAAKGKGEQMLEDARRELRHGQIAVARRLAAAAYADEYGVKRQAADLLRSIDQEEANQQILTAKRSAEAVFAAFNRHDYVHAARIAQAIDVAKLLPEQANRLKEIMLLPEMQPTGVVRPGSRPRDLALVDKGTLAPGLPLAPPEGKASATDLGNGGKEPGQSRLLTSVVGMQEVKFQQLHEEGRKVQRQAMRLFREGETQRALDVLMDYQESLDRTALDPARLAQLRRPIEDRLQKLRTLKSQREFERDQVAHGASRHDVQNRMYKMEQQKKEKVAQLMKQYNTLYQEGKYPEAEMMAQKALELDPDNVAAAAGVQVARLRNGDHINKTLSREKADFFDAAMDDAHHFGPNVVQKIMHVDPEFAKRARKRKGLEFINSSLKNQREQAIERRLSAPISLNFKDTPLSQVIEDLHDMSGVNVVPDKAALEEAGIGLESQLTLKLENVSMKSALNVLLQQVHLTYVIKDEVLQITTEDNAKGKLKRVTYPVADLVVPVENHVLPNSSNMNYILDQHLATNMPNGGTGPMPYVSPLGMGGGAPVSTPSNGTMSTSASYPTYPGLTPPAPTPQRAPGQTIEDLLIKLITSTISPNSWSDVGGQGTIQYFPLGLALVINQTTDIQEQIQDLLAALRKLQDLEVAIEMRLISVSESFFERIGLDFNVNIVNSNRKYDNNLLTGQFQPFGFINKFTPSQFTAGITPAGTFTQDLGIPLKDNSFALTTPPFGNYPGLVTGDGGLSLGLAFLSDIQVYMFMEAAQGDRRFNLMQAPKLTMFNGQSATLNVSDVQFFLTSVMPDRTDRGEIFFRPMNTPFPFGVSLNVQPVISADRRFVRMSLNPFLTNLTNASVPVIPIQIPVDQVFEGGVIGPNQQRLFQIFLQQPTLNTITLATTVSVPDGGTVLLGGLKTLVEGRTEYGPPILSKIPYINRLFKNVGYGREAQSLLIMVTPRIIINAEEQERQVGADVPEIPGQ